MLHRLWRDETGLTTVEYALLLALVAVAAIGAWRLLGSHSNTTVSRANEELSVASGA